ncbi:hypothetical protein ACFFOV_06060 [Cerasicoccus arenae]
MRMLRLALILFAAIAALHAQEIPEGFRVQKLPMGGKALMPKDWHYEGGGLDNGFMYVFSKEEMTGEGYETGFRIQGFFKVSEAGFKPSEAAAQNLEKFKSNAKSVIKVCDEYDQGPFRVRCLEAIQPNPHNAADDYHVIYSFFWNDDADMVVVSMFGAPESTWPEAELIYKEMQGFVLFDPSKAKE